MAQFWVDHAVAMWTRNFRQVSFNQELSVTENARYFAMLYLTGSDALIACFQDKERHSLWRPTTAIRLADIDGNAATVADPNWTSLIGVPPYSDHPSGHNCASSSFVETLRDFFGTNQMSFSATRATSPIGPITRHFTRFSQAINEVRRACLRRDPLHDGRRAGSVARQEDRQVPTGPLLPADELGGGVADGGAASGSPTSVHQRWEPPFLLSHGSGSLVVSTAER